MTDRSTNAPGDRDGAVSPERLAALLDGRLRGAERDALLARLAGSDEDLAAFADAAVVQRELEAEDEAAGTPGVLPLRRPEQALRRMDRRWLAIAAVVAAAALAPFAWRASQPGAVTEPAQAVALLQTPLGGLPAGWLDAPAWAVTRGAGGVADDGGTAARLGAYVVDLELAIRARDADATALLARRAAQMLTEASTAGTLAARHFTALADRAGAPAAELLPVLADGSDAAAQAGDADRFALGAWAEAARLAAARRDAEFFRDGRTGRTLDRADEAVADDVNARAAIATLRAESQDEAPDWIALERASADLLRVIAS